ncbi:MAG: peptide chain release factor N(5)-glutamine methyltransferase [Anaerolineales bacterium]|nr:peptide chain release factor N(5)-glutamine methyltransferase [Anaerolineales bacterium]
MTRPLLQILQEIHQRLAPVTDTPNLDAQVLLSNILGRPRSWVMAHPEAMISRDQQELLNKALERLEDNEPLPYVIGHWEFFGLDFIVSPNALIPRPETELLVEWALKWLQEQSDRRLVLDVGTGTGAIAVALAAQIADLKVVASDISFLALQTAQQNINQHGLHDRIALVQSDLIPSTALPFDLICSNLPYIPTETLQNLDVYLREPQLALDGGHEGLTSISRLLEQLGHNPMILASHGLLLIEIDATQGLSVQNLVKHFLPQADTQVVRDLTGRDRLTVIQMNKVY